MSDTELIILYVVAITIGAGGGLYAAYLQSRIWARDLKIWDLRTQIIYWHTYDALGNSEYKSRFKETFIDPPENLNDGVDK